LIRDGSYAHMHTLQS